MRLAIQIDPSFFEELPTHRKPLVQQMFVKAFLEFVADKTKERLKQVIDRQLYTWKPLSKTWQAYNLFPLVYFNDL